MAENENIPVKEQDDGSALVALEMTPDPLADAGDDNEGKKKKKKDND